MYYAFALPNGTLVRPGGRPGKFVPPKSSVPLTEQQYQQLKQYPGSLALRDGQIVTIS